MKELLKYSAAIIGLVIMAAGGSPALAEWPERALTLVSPLPRDLPWGPSPQAALLEALIPRLSRELGVPVNYLVQSEGDGLLAANSMILASDEGYVITALGNEPAVNLVIQGYTPYAWGEMIPAATLWQLVYVIIARSDYPAKDFNGLAAAQKDAPREPARLGRLNPGPVSSAELMAMEAARAAGFAWSLVETTRPDPEVLLENQADFMVLPLADFKTHPRRDKFKPLLVLSQAEPQGAEGWPNLKSQSLPVTIRSFFAIYLPANFNWRSRGRLGAAINNALRVRAVARQLLAAGLLPYIEDAEGVIPLLNQEHENQTKLLASFGLIEPPSAADPAKY